MSRTELFGLALKSAGISCAAFIAKHLAEPASESAVWGVAAGRVKSARISTAIDQLIEQERPRLLRALQAPLRQAA